MEKTLHMINIIPILFSYKYASATGQRLINNKTITYIDKPQCDVMSSQIRELFHACAHDH
jgi:hypothetical protein